MAGSQKEKTEVKGTVVRFILDFVRDTFGPAGLERVLGDLSPRSRERLARAPISSEWYPVGECVIAPLEAMSERFYRGSMDGVWSCGRYGADQLAAGIYRNLMEVYGAPRLLGRADRVVGIFYRPVVFEVTHRSAFEVVLDLVEFAGADRTIEAHIGGFIERGIELGGNTDVEVAIGPSLAAGDAHTRFCVTWKPIRSARTDPQDRQ